MVRLNELAGAAPLMRASSALNAAVPTPLARSSQRRSPPAPGRIDCGGLNLSSTMTSGPVSSVIPQRYPVVGVSGSAIENSSSVPTDWRELSSAIPKHSI